jgi:hypothetical protein
MVVLAIFLGSASLADAQVFKPRGKGSKTAKSSAKKPASAAAKKAPTTAKRSGKAPAKKSGGKKATGRPADLTPDPDEDYVVIEDLEDDE